MQDRFFPPLGRPLSRLVLGSMSFSGSDPAVRERGFALLDRWMEVGGNVVDTAHIYGGGSCERTIGAWLNARGCRSELVILGKGAHHNQDRNRVTPEDITCDLRDSLARLRTEYIDLYVLHRDDPNVPVGEIVDALNRHLEAGSIRAFGGSNWTTARLEAANAYASSHGLSGFACSSPHLSLAAPREPAWPGCIDARDAVSLAWYKRTQLPLFAWSSQARGFFSGRYTPENAPEDALIDRCYNTAENWARLERARALGQSKGFSAIQVALSWVLCQPFPVYALVGPANEDELDSCVKALDLALSAEEVRQLAEG